MLLLAAAALLSGVNAFAFPPNEQSLLAAETSVYESDLSKIVSDSPMLSFHRNLIEIESISGNELSVGEYVISYLEERGFTVSTQEAPQTGDKKRFDVLARLPGADLDAKVKTVVSSHIDTVPPYLPYNISTKSTNGAAFKREDVLITGRGSVDAKGSVATQVYAVLELLSSKAINPSDVSLLFVVGEENSGDGMRAFSSSAENTLDYGTVIFGEPTELKLATGHKGILHVDIKAKGKAAHSGYPWLGRSANSMMIPALAIMDKIGNTPEKDGGLPASEKYGNTTVNLGLLAGGVAANVVAEEATLRIACRLAGGDAEKSKKIISKALEALGDGYELTFGAGYGPIDIDADVEGFETITVNYGTDIPNLKVDEKTKRYLYGPGSIFVAHSDHEAITIGDLETAVEGYKKLILHSLK